jgi:hypothetical protein
MSPANYDFRFRENSKAALLAYSAAELSQLIKEGSLLEVKNE